MYVSSTQPSQNFILRRFWTLILSPNYIKVIILSKKPWQDCKINANVIQINRLEKTGICVHKFVTKNSWLEIFTGCNMHMQSTNNHIHIYLKMLVLISFMFLLWTLLNIKQESLNSCSHTTTIHTKITILLECDIASLSDWCPMFYDNVTVSSTRVKMSECHLLGQFKL